TTPDSTGTPATTLDPTGTPATTPSPTGTPGTTPDPTRTTPDVAPSFSSGATNSTESSSPLVRRIAKEHNVDISRIRGTGIGGRVTKQDILAFIENAPSFDSQSGRAATG